MKRFILPTLSLSVAAVFAAGCQDVKEDINVPEEIVVDRNVITASIPEALTKVSMNAPEDGVGLELAWEAEDQLTVIGNTTETFTIADGYTTHKAQFNGTAVEGDSFTILYPGQTYKTLDDINAVKFTEQTQKGNANTDHLSYFAMIETADYTTLDFSKAKQNGVLKFHFQLPEGAGVVNSITLSATSDIFYVTNDLDGDKTNVLTLNLEDVDVSASEQMLTAYMMIPWHDVTLASGSALTVSVQMPDSKFEQVLTVPEAGLTILSGKVNTFGLNNSNWEEPLFFAGTGTEADPYQIKTFRHLQNVVKPLSNGMTEKVWYKLIADIDMAGQEWSMIAPSADLKYLYDFNGNDYTIKNFTYEGKSGASFFGALTGGSKVHDLKFDNVVLSDETDGGSSVAVVSYDVKEGVIDNVDVKNVTITSATGAGNGTGTGVIASRLDTGTISNCDVENITITATAERVAGIVGINASNGNTIENCTVKDAVISGTYAVGGIVGRSSSTPAVNITGCKLLGTNTITCTGTSTGGIIGEAGGASNISGCEVSGATSVTGTKYTAGIIGYAKGATTVSSCTVSGTGSISGTESTGGIVGLADSKATISGCNVSGATITNTGDRTGGVVGFFNAGNSSIDDCHLSSSTLNGTTRTGGMLGQVSNADTTSPTTISNCTATNVTLYGKGSTTDDKNGVWIGGILGRNHSSVGVTIHDCTTDVTISTDMTAEDQSNLGGIVGETGGTLTMYNCSSTATITGRKRLGGLVGAAGNAGSNIYQCAYLGGKISGVSIMGGIVGYANNNVIIADCYSVEAEISGTGGYLGGILGYTLSTSANDISNCYSTMAIATSGSKQNGVGGVVGCFGDSSEGSRKTQNSGTVAKCIAWNTEIGSNNGGTNGCVVGAAGWLSTLSDCWRNPAMKTAFSENPGDHENSSSSSPLTASPYNGKVAADNATVSSIAKTLDWSSTTWDFTNALPTLKNLK